jgi:hypothetical protein
VTELRRHGFNVRRVEDGLPEWRAAGMPLEAGTPRQALLRADKHVRSAICNDWARLAHITPDEAYRAAEAQLG